MQLSDEQLATIITWAKKTSDVEAVFLRGSRTTGTAASDSDVELALSITGQDPLRRLATFISHRRAWRRNIEPARLICVDVSSASCCSQQVCRVSGE
jgi:predicted nucleotidyltransferase